MELQKRPNYTFIQTHDTLTSGHLPAIPKSVFGIPVVGWLFGEVLDIESSGLVSRRVWSGMCEML